MEKCEKSCWIGHPDQLMMVRRFCMEESRSAGLECIEVQSSSGLSFTVAAGRAMSLQAARYKGKNITYMPAAGPTGPMYSWQMTHYYEGGLMFTCGLESTGPANGKYPQHGTLRSLPGQDVTITRMEKDGIPGVRIQGNVIQSGLGCPTLVLQRTIECWDNKAEIKISDRVCNRSHQKAGVMIMYHFNFGWPLLSPAAKLTIPSDLVKPKDETAARHLDCCLKTLAPQSQWVPEVFQHFFDPEKQEICICLENPEIDMGIQMKVDPQQLPYLNHWRNFAEDQYVMGLEPCNCLPLGRTKAEEKKMVPYLLPGEEAQFDISLEIAELDQK